MMTHQQSSVSDAVMKAAQTAGKSVISWNSVTVMGWDLVRRANYMDKIFDIAALMSKSCERTR